MHTSHLGYSTTLAPVFALRCRSQLRDEDLIVYGLMHHATGSGLIHRPAGQIAEIDVMVAALAHAAGTAARECIEAGRAEEFPADAARPRLMFYWRSLV